MYVKQDIQKKIKKKNQRVNIAQNGIAHIILRNEIVNKKGEYHILFLILC